MQFIYKIQKFMMGRYGVDNLYRFLLMLYFILIVIDLFFNNIVLTVLEFLVIFIMFYRVFSKNIKQRRKENELFLEIKKKCIKPFEVIKKNREDKYHIYKRCPKCKTILRLPLPNKRGIKHAKCPHCKKKVTLFTLKYQKVEIIRKKK